MFKGFFLGLGSAAAVLGVIIAWPHLAGLIRSPAASIRAAYADNLYLLEHDYVYAVTLNINGSKTGIYMIKKESGGFDLWEPGQTANRIHATAFMIDSSGVCATSGYAVAPWANAGDRRLIADALSEEFDLKEHEIDVQGYSTRIVLKKFSGDTAEINYRPLGFTEPDSEQVGFLQRADKGIRLSFHTVRFQPAINMDKEKVYLLGSPELERKITVPLEIRVLPLQKKPLQYPDHFSFEETGEWLPEGSPVFNKSGELLGVYSFYNHTGDQHNNIMSTSIRNTADLAGYLQRLAHIPAAENFMFLDDSLPAPAKKEWVTLLKAHNDNNAADSSANGIRLKGSVSITTHEASWYSQAMKIDGSKTRLKIIVSRFVTDDEDPRLLTIRVLQAASEQDTPEEIFSVQYDSEGTYIENMWELDGFLTIQAEGMEGCLFNIEVQAEMVKNDYKQ